MTLPNFFLIGAPKSGTTSLYHYLKQHPEIFMCPEKEPSFFLFMEGRDEIKFPVGLIPEDLKKKILKRTFPTMGEYLSLFRNVKAEKIIGEASPHYLIGPNTPQNIYTHVPDAKIMAIFRNPFDAAYSEYLMTSRHGEWLEGISFMELLKAEDLSKEDNWELPNFIRTRLYDMHINKYLNTFNKNQIRFFLFEDLKNPAKLLKDTFSFLEVSTDFESDISMKYNVNSPNRKKYQVSIFQKGITQPIKKLLKQSISPFMSLSNTSQQSETTDIHQPEPVICPSEEKEFLRPIFTPSILKLQDLIDRDLSHWLT